MSVPVLFMLSWEAFEPRHSIVCRADEPRHFWWNVVLYVLAGLIFVGLYLYQNAR
jgi:hypothetical protein